jgi:hypothetical protein
LADVGQRHSATGLIRYGRATKIVGQAVEHSDDGLGAASGVDPERVGPSITIINAVLADRCVHAFTYAVAVPDRGPAQERGLTAGDHGFGWRAAKPAPPLWTVGKRAISKCLVSKRLEMRWHHQDEVLLPLALWCPGPGYGMISSGVTGGGMGPRE